MDRHWINDLTSTSTDKCCKTLHALYTVLTQSRNVRINYTSDVIIIYSNDIVGLYKQLEQEDLLMVLDNTTEAKITIPEGSIHRKYSRYNFRVVLKTSKVSAECKSNIVKFAKTYKGSINLSKGLYYWLHVYTFLGPTLKYYFDTNESDIDKMFDLAVPGVRSQTLKIISDKYNTTEILE